MITIYSIYNKITNMRYIGMTCSIRRRFKEHRHALNKNKHHNSHLQNSWNLYGKDNFIFQKIEICNENIADEREIYYISLFSTDDKNFGYNLTSGGNRPIMSKQTREKMSKSHLGKRHPRTKEHTENLRKALIGRKLSASHIEKLKDRYRKELHPMQGKLHPARKLIYCITNGITYESAIDAGLKLNIDPSGINKVCNLKRKQENGYRFIRIEDFIGWL